jgi:hypothetical protein
MSQAAVWPLVARQSSRLRCTDCGVVNGHFTATTANQALIDNTRILKPTLVNEFRFGFNHFFNDIGVNYVVDPIKQLGIGVFDPPPAAWGTPSIGILGFPERCPRHLQDHGQDDRFSHGCRRQRGRRGQPKHHRTDHA